MHVTLLLESLIALIGGGVILGCGITAFAFLVKCVKPDKRPRF